MYKTKIFPLIWITIFMVLVFVEPPRQSAWAQDGDSNRQKNGDLAGRSSSQNPSGQFVYPPPLKSAEEHVYKSVGDVQLRLWVYRPSTVSAAPVPAVVFFFGGGWSSGSPQQFEQHCEYLKSRGMVGITCDYRVASRHAVKAVSCVEDAKSAIRWVRQNATLLGVDPDRIAAAGGSAGGHIAACTGTLKDYDHPQEDLSVSSVPNAMVLFNPALLLAPLTPEDSSHWSEEKFAELAPRLGVPPRSLSPAHHVTAGLPPTLILHGEQDSTVPFATARVFADRMKSHGNRCELAAYSHAGHGFFNRRGRDTTLGTDRPEIDNQIQWNRRTILRMDTFLQSLGWLDEFSSQPVVDNDHIRVRGSLINSWHTFTTKHRGHVAFIGGSITEMNGYRPLMETWLKQQFPDTSFEFTNAGIASTCSHTGAFRLNRDVLQDGPVDLIFVEFAVNDDQDAMHSEVNCQLGMEGIIRHVRQHNPYADIVLIHFVNPSMVESLKAGKEPLSSRQHERLARYYGVSSAYVSREVTYRIMQGSLTWDEFGGTHPGPVGNALAADMVQRLLSAGWSVRHQPQSTGPLPGVAEALPHPMPDTNLQQGGFDNGVLVPHSELELATGWKIGIPAWADIPGSFRSRFANEICVFAEQPDAELTLKFTGNAVGVYVLAGPDAGQLEYQLDGGGWQQAELFHSFSTGLHYPRTIVLASQLAGGPHAINVRISHQKHAESKGYAARILSFVVNK